MVRHAKPKANMFFYVSIMRGCYFFYDFIIINSGVGSHTREKFTLETKLVQNRYEMKLFPSTLDTNNSFDSERESKHWFDSRLLKEYLALNWSIYTSGQRPAHAANDE